MSRPISPEQYEPQEPDWIYCGTCHGDGTVLEGEFDWVCPHCDGDGGYEL